MDSGGPRLSLPMGIQPERRPRRASPPAEPRSVGARGAASPPRPPAQRARTPVETRRKDPGSGVDPREEHPMVRYGHPGPEQRQQPTNGPIPAALNEQACNAGDRHHRQDNWGWPCCCVVTCEHLEELLGRERNGHARPIASDVRAGRLPRSLEESRSAGARLARRTRGARETTERSRGAGSKGSVSAHGSPARSTAEPCGRPSGSISS